MHRWWWKDGEKQYEVFWGNELFVGQVVDPMIKHYCESANQQLAAQAPSAQLQQNITDEIQSITVNFFTALSAKREKTQDDIARSEKRVAHLAEMVKTVNNLMDFYEKNH